VGIVYKTIKDGISDGGIANIIMPEIDRCLISHNGRGDTVAIFNQGFPAACSRETLFSGVGSAGKPIV